MTFDQMRQYPMTFDQIGNVTYDQIRQYLMSRVMPFDQIRQYPMSYVTK